MEQDLQKENNRLYRLFEKFSSEAKAISIATVALVVSTLALLMAFMAVYDALHVKATLTADERSSAVAYRQMEREYRLLQLKVDEHRAAMMAAGIDPNFHLEGESN